MGKLPLMAAAGLFVALAVFLAAKFGMTPSYQSTTRIYVLAKQDNAMVTYNDLQTGTQLTKDYAELICSRFVLEEVIEQLGLSLNYEQLKANVSVSSPSDTPHHRHRGNGQRPGAGDGNGQRRAGGGHRTYSECDGHRGGKRGGNSGSAYGKIRSGSREDDGVGRSLWRFPRGGSCGDNGVVQ